MFSVERHLRQALSERPHTPDRARHTLAAFCKGIVGLAGAGTLFTYDNTKTLKSEVPTMVLHLYPYVLRWTEIISRFPAVTAFEGYTWYGKDFMLCPCATAGCAAACLGHEGRLGMSHGQRAMAWRTLFVVMFPRTFAALLVHEIERMAAKHEQFAVRLNGTSDIKWEKVMPWLFDEAPDNVTFYDYTKWESRSTPDNYDLTVSISEKHDTSDIQRLVNEGNRVAVVVRRSNRTNEGKRPLPATYAGCAALDGDNSDFRPAEPKGTVVMLRAKGDAIHDESGFVKEMV